MPKMINLKRTTDDKDAYCMTAYPAGLCMYLSHEQCEQLGIDKALKTGTEVTISAKAIVTSSTEELERENGEGKDVRLTLQITDMGVDVGSVLKNAASILYSNK